MSRTFSSGSFHGEFGSVNPLDELAHFFEAQLEKRNPQVRAAPGIFPGTDMCHTGLRLAR